MSAFSSFRELQASGGAAATYTIDQSLRFDDTNPSYLSRTPSTQGDRKTWTLSCWVKRGNITLGDNATLLVCRPGGTEETSLRIETSDQLRFIHYNGTHDYTIYTDAVLRDPSAWYHIVAVCDTSNANPTDRKIIYVNGARQPVTIVEQITQNFEGWVNTTASHDIGYRTYSSDDKLDGYLAEYHFVDGQALDPSYFGEADSSYGHWKPIEVDISTTPKASYGTNGFYLPFSGDQTASGFSAITYTGSGSSKSLTDVGFSPDLVWIKARTGTKNHYLFDTNRGANHRIQSSETDADLTQANTLTSFDTKGFTVGTEGGQNESGTPFVAWSWDAGSGSYANNTDGTITSSLKANTAKGFSIFSYTGNADNTVGHGLGASPDMVIFKNTGTATNWCVWHSGLSQYYAFEGLNTTGAATGGVSGKYVNSVNSTTIDMGDDISLNQSGHSYIAYAWTAISGYSAFGSYSGTGSAGNSITTGFKPAFVMIKRTDSTGDWCMYDAVRGNDDFRLEANTTDAEDTQRTAMDFTDTGFTLLDTTLTRNASGGTYIYMAFADTKDSAFYYDQSGNSNNFENKGFDNSDIMLDTPTNNFCTWNPLNSNGTFYEGNLKLVSSGTSPRSGAGNFAISSGKWYSEFVVTFGNSSDYGVLGIVPETFDGIGGTTSYSAGENGVVYSAWDGQKRIDGTATAYGDTWTSGDIIGIAVDMDGGSVAFYINGVSQGSISYTESSAMFVFSSADGSTGHTVYANFGQDSSFAGNKTSQGNSDSNGKGDFYYAPPTGYLALCTANLPDPAVKPKEHFNTVLYGGNGGNSINPSATQSITGVGFQPDFTWIKSRSEGTSSYTGHNVVHDVVRGLGTNSALITNGNYSESGTGYSDAITSFDSDGFTLGPRNQVNYYGDEFAAWNWKANGSGVSNSDGTITSTVSANQDAGFSIVSYTGTQVDATVGHGLSSKPEMIIIKDRDTAYDWIVYFDGVTTADNSELRLNNNSSVYTGLTDDRWVISSMSSSVIGLGGTTTVNKLNSDHIAYCFHSVEGYSKFGSYTGNGSTDGTFVYTGFRPAFLLIKRYDSGTSNNWVIYDAKRDPYNYVDGRLYPNLTSAESGGGPSYSYDFTSNGFKLRSVGSEHNASGGTYIYMAFAEYPFKYSNARGTSYDKFVEPSTQATTISQSLRFNDDDTAYLSRTPAAAGNRKTWTWSGWVKRGNLSSYQTIFSGGDNTSNNDAWFRLRAYHGSVDQIEFRNISSGSYTAQVHTSRMFRDASAWYHIVLSVDTTQSTASDRIKIYVNGVQETLTFTTTPSQNTDLSINISGVHELGRIKAFTDYYLDGYMADVHFIDGQALGPEHFGYEDTTYGDWRPKAYADGNPEADYGGNGFHLEFASGAIGTDSSPMGNDWTANNLANSDVMSDTPNNNLATWNPLVFRRTGSYAPTFQKGNLKVFGNSSQVSHTVSTIASSGKHYAEFLVGDGTSTITGPGVVRSYWDDGLAQSYAHNYGGSFYSDSGVRHYNSTSDSQSAPGSNRVGIEVDFGNNEVTYYIVQSNGTRTQQGSTLTSSDGIDFKGLGVFTATLHDSSSRYVEAYFDENLWWGTPTTDYVELSVANLPAVTINPKDYFKTMLYTGDGASDHGITGVGFQPDLTWIKNRSNQNYHMWYDSLRGATNYLYVNEKNAEGVRTGGLTSFDADGFTVGNLSAENANGTNLVSWNWKCNGGTSATNNDGTITSTVTANQDVGFSMLTYTGNGTAGSTIGHGLGETPAIILVKMRTGGNNEWSMYHHDQGVSDPETDAWLLDLNYAKGDNAIYWNDTAPTSSVFSVGTNNGRTNLNGGTYVAYCWAEREGYSKFGYYTGNGSSNGPFVYTGFKPAFVLLKANAVYNWILWDSDRQTYNQMGPAVYPDVNNAESTPASNAIDILSNGFKLRNTGGASNTNGGTFIYLAFAENPFKHTNAR